MRPSWQMDLRAVDLLQTDDQHWAVVFLEDRWPNLDDVVRSHGKEEAIEGSVVELAQREAVADDRLALGIAVGGDVRGVEQFEVPKATEGAPVLVGTEDSFAERHLMQPTPEGRRDVGTPRFRILRGRVWSSRRQRGAKPSVLSLIRKRCSCDAFAARALERALPVNALI